MATNLEGGPAFPCGNQVPYNREKGMTLRDYFAAKAMAALFDSDAAHFPAEVTMIAAEAYAMADAMLAERDK